MPEVLVTGGGGSFEGLAATLMQAVRTGIPSMGGPAGAVDAEIVEEEPAVVEEEVLEAEPEPVG